MCQKDGRSGWLPLSYLRRGSFTNEEDVLGFLSSKLANGGGTYRCGGCRGVCEMVEMNACDGMLRMVHLQAYLMMDKQIRGWRLRQRCTEP